MDEPRALVRNAADPVQVARAGRREQDATRRYLEALRASLQHAEVRYVFSELLERAGLFVCVFEHNGSALQFREGRRNFGLELWTDLERADVRAVELMETERRARRHRDDRTTDAGHVAAAEENDVP